MRKQEINDKVTVAMAARMLRTDERFILGCVTSGWIASTDDGRISGQALYEMVKARREITESVDELAARKLARKQEEDRAYFASYAPFLASERRRAMKMRLTVVHGRKAVSA